MTQALLEMRGISKSYGSVQANQGVNLTVMPGQIVGLLGENGSGKSTLMKVLFGMVRPDEGTMVYQGRELRAGNPRDALQRGIAMIHQHFTLVEAMTVTENLMLGWAHGGAWLDSRGMAARAYFGALALSMVAIAGLTNVTVPLGSAVFPKSRMD